MCRHCDMSNRNMFHGHPMGVVQPTYAPSQIEWNFIIFSYSRQIQNCQLSGNFYGSKHNSSVSCLESSLTKRMRLTQ